jgi:feruloyl esterase
VFRTPPTPLAVFGPDPIAYYLAYDFDTDPQKMFATTETYTESAWDFLMDSFTDLSAFRDGGGRFIVVSGVSEPRYSTNDHINWWEEVNRINDGAAADFVRLFAVPGLINIGIANPATDQFDALSAIIDWVENGIPPDRIIATAGDRSPWPGRTRPLCPWPQQARYKGSGSIEEAANFDCVDVGRN